MNHSQYNFNVDFQQFNYNPAYQYFYSPNFQQFASEEDSLLNGYYTNQALNSYSDYPIYNETDISDLKTGRGISFLSNIGNFIASQVDNFLNIVHSIQRTLAFTTGFIQVTHLEVGDLNEKIQTIQKILETIDEKEELSGVDDLQHHLIEYEHAINLKLKQVEAAKEEFFKHHTELNSYLETARKYGINI